MKNFENTEYFTLLCLTTGKYSYHSLMQFETVTTEEFKMFEKIQAYLASQLDIPADEITATPRSKASASIRWIPSRWSLDLEEQLGVDLELEEKIATVGELVDFVEQA